MHKIWLVIRMEYLRRIKSRAFIISTLLTPVLMAALVVVPILAAVWSEKDECTVYIQDETGVLATELLSDNVVRYKPNLTGIEERKLLLTQDEALLVIPSDISRKQVNAQLISVTSLSISQRDRIRKDLDRVIHDYRIQTSGILPEQLEALEYELDIAQTKLSTEGEQSASTDVAAMLGYVMSFLVYMLLIFYGSSVMRGVMEEKVNRLGEIITSSIRPFEFMMGKIIGIGAVGLTQFLIWIFLGAGLIMAAMLIVMGTVDMSKIQSPQGGQMDAAQVEQQALIMQALLEALDWKLFLLFIFYFMGGFFFYGSLYAAVGSAVDEEADAQQLSWPVTIPQIIPMVLLGSLIQSPNGSLAQILSYLPFTSPNVMMLRYLAADVSGWELALSMGLLAGGVILSVWFAGKIYRVGILMYGKKVKLSELILWIRYK